MSFSNGLLFAKGTSDIRILPHMANRHGLIAGATGTGKTVSLQVLCERFSSIGVPVFLADVKGDLSGIAKPGASNSKIDERITNLGLEGFSFSGFPVTFWDVFGQQGHPMRTTVSEMGALLFSKLLNLNETQSGIMHIVFKIADDMGMLLIDLKDLRAMLRYVGDNSSEFTTQYGSISKQSIGAIQRGLLTLEEQGAELFFGEPALDIRDFMKVDSSGKGFINILASDKLFLSPALYSTFLLWLLSELFEELPEVGDLDKPKIVFFFDEAHLLFKEASKALLQKVEQVVRLIRSKGVGVYFITQNPDDIPETVLGQLGNRVQHALRAFTPRDQNAVRAAAQTFRANPELNIETVITELGVGEALISFLDEKGSPSIVEKAFVLPPRSNIGPLSVQEREGIIRGSLLYGKYEKTIDRFSAFESLQEEEERQKAAKAAEEERKNYEKLMRQQTRANSSRTNYGNSRRTTQRSRTTDTPLNRFAKSAMSSIGRQVGNELVRGILGSFLRR